MLPAKFAGIVLLLLMMFTLTGATSNGKCRFIVNTIVSKVEIMERRLSDEGLKFIKEKEGVRNRVYNDGVGILTGGAGHRLTPEEVKNFGPTGYVPDCQIDAWLKVDVKKAEECVNNWVLVDLTQTGFDVLVSFVYNIGCDQFKRSTLLKLLNKGFIKEASEEFSRWVYARGKKLPGLVSRRADEARLFRDAETEDVLA